jgi:hypothetical protein
METKNPNGICALLAQIGEENIKVQNIADCCTEINQKKNGFSTLKIETKEMTPKDLILDGGKMGLIVWFPKDKLPDWAKRI